MYCGMHDSHIPKQVLNGKWDHSGLRNNGQRLCKI